MGPYITFILCCILSDAFSQNRLPHVQAHAHNDYEHAKPLWDAIEMGFISVEADVHLVKGKLLVSHGKPKEDARTIQQLYLTPLDSLLSHNGGKIYPNYNGSFYLMIDCKTDAESTYAAIQKAVVQYENLLCHSNQCPVKIFISGNRAMDTLLKNGYNGIALDGRPGDLGKGISSELMPVISDLYSNWSSWQGKSNAQPEDLARIRELANRVHAEGKKLRLWAIPDHEKAWKALLDSGIDFINTDRLTELNAFLNKNGL
jgi:hypothetical protein